MRHVFVSYSHSDADFTQILRDKLLQSDFRTWMDRALNIGDDWRVEIDLGIRDALAAIVIISPASMRSAYVNYEWGFAVGSGVPLVPVLLKNPDRDLHPRLEALNRLDFTNYSTRPWNQLIQALRDIQDALRPATVHVSRDAPPVIQEVAKELDSMDERRRQAAIDTLAKMDHPAILEILAEAARHPIQQVRIAASVYLGERQDIRALPGLLEGIRTRDDRVEGWMLGKLGPPAVPALIAAMGDSDDSVRKRIHWALGMIGGPEATDVLVRLLHDPEADNRSDAAFSLRDCPAAIPALLGAMHDPDRTVRLEAIRAVVKSAGQAVGSAEVFPPLLEALGDEYDQVAISAGEGLGQSGDPRAIPHLLRAALSHPSDQVRMFSKRALSSFGAAPAGALREAVSDPDPQIRARAIRILGGIHEERDLPLLTGATRDRDPIVREAAISTLEGVRDKTAVSALIERLDDEEERLARYAAIALERSPDPDAVAALIAALAKDEEIAEAAAGALESIGTREARRAAAAWKRQNGK